MVNDLAVIPSDSDWETALPLLFQAVSNSRSRENAAIQLGGQNVITNPSLFDNSKTGMVESPHAPLPYGLDPLISVQRKAHDIKAQILENTQQLPRTDVMPSKSEELDAQDQLQPCKLIFPSLRPGEMYQVSYQARYTYFREGKLRCKYCRLRRYKQNYK